VSWRADEFYAEPFDIKERCQDIQHLYVTAVACAHIDMEDPKVVVAIGACAVGGGIWFDTYNVVGGVDKVIPVDIYIPGCPPKPEAIIYGVALALGLVPKKIERVEERQETPEELAQITAPTEKAEVAAQ